MSKEPDYALENHKMAMSARLDLFKSTIALAIEAIKTSSLVSGGAAIAAMALVGQTAGPRPAIAAAVAGLMPLFWFALLASAVASATAYLAQVCFQRQHESFEISMDHPFVLDTAASAKWGRSGLGFQFLTMFLIAIAYGLLLIAFWRAAEHLQTLLASAR